MERGSATWPVPIPDDDIVVGLLGSFRLTWVHQDRVPGGRPAIVDPETFEVHESWRPATVVAVRRSLAGVDELDVRDEFDGSVFPVTPFVLPDQVSGPAGPGNWKPPWEDLRVWRGTMRSSGGRLPLNQR